jgi:hypothetical protein
LFVSSSSFLVSRFPATVPGIGNFKIFSQKHITFSHLGRLREKFCHGRIYPVQRRRGGIAGLVYGRRPAMCLFQGRFFHFDSELSIGFTGDHGEPVTGDFYAIAGIRCWLEGCFGTPCLAMTTSWKGKTGGLLRHYVPRNDNFMVVERMEIASGFALALTNEYYSESVLRLYNDE